MQESSLAPSCAVAPCALWGAPQAGGAPNLGTAHKILGGAVQGGQVPGVFAAEIRAAPVLLGDIKLERPSLRR